MKTVRKIVRKRRASAARLQSWRVGLLAFGLVLGVLVAACSGEARSPEPAANPPAASQNSATSQDSAVNNSDSAAATNNSSTNAAASQAALPGTEEFGLSKEGLVTTIEAVEAGIAKCMSAAGFEYIAVDYNTARQGMVADKSLPGLSEREFFEQYGYGISTLYTGLDPQSADENTPAKIGLGEQNVQIFNTLSEADQVAYNRTLFGEYTDATFAVTLEAEDFSRTGGCTRTAIEQVFSPEQLTVTYYNPKDAIVQQEPRMIAALAEFADCIHEAGFDYNHPEEIEPDLKSRLDAITAGAPLETLSPEDRAALTELQGEERAVAVVALDCEESIIEPVEEQILRELY